MNTLTRIISIHLACGLLLVFNQLDAQSPRVYEREAAKKLEAKDFYSAMAYYGIVLEMQPQRTDMAFGYAEAARQFGAYGAAEQQYAKVVAAPEAGAYPTAVFQLAEMKKILGKYDEALPLYQQYANASRGLGTDPDLRQRAP